MIFGLGHCQARPVEYLQHSSNAFSLLKRVFVRVSTRAFQGLNILVGIQTKIV